MSLQYPRNPTDDNGLASSNSGVKASRANTEREFLDRNLIVAAVFYLVELFGSTNGICNEKQNRPSKATP